MNTAKLGPYLISFDNSEEYHRIKREVWGANTYYVDPDLLPSSPTIIDAGAHIGLTTLYYKKIFPDSRIIALEPLPPNAELFRRNMFQNQIEGVVLEEVALSDSVGTKDYYYDASVERWYSTASFTAGAWNGEQESARTTVTTNTLAHYLSTYKPNLVKMDIEGAEERVLYAAREVLALCQHYLIEFHPIGGVGMERIVQSFAESGFMVTVVKNGQIVPWDKARGLSLIEAVRRWDRTF